MAVDRPEKMSDRVSTREDLARSSVSPLEEERLRRKIDEISKEHRSFLVGLATKLCRSKFDPQDLVQDVFIRAWKHIDSLPPDANVRAWLARVMQNLFIDWVRKRASGPRAVPIDDVPLAIPEPVERDWWSEIAPEHVRAKMDALGPELKGAFELHTFESCSYAEIAERLKIPKATVGTRILRARRKLKQLLSEGQDQGQGNAHD
jgi:RNA polymerase sigma-70 factor, ECF subfamily